MIKRHQWIQFGKLIIGILIGILILYGIGRAFPLFTQDHHRMIFRMIAKGIVYLALLLAVGSALVSFLASQQLFYPRRRVLYFIGCGLIVCYLTIGLLILNHGMRMDASATSPSVPSLMISFLV